MLTAQITNGVFTIDFTNKAGSTFTVLGTAELSAASSWTNLGAAVEISSGRFQFSDFGTRTNPPFFFASPLAVTTPYWLPTELLRR